MATGRRCKAAGANEFTERGLPSPAQPSGIGFWKGTRERPWSFAGSRLEGEGFSSCQEHTQQLTLQRYHHHLVDDMPDNVGEDEGKPVSILFDGVKVGAVSTKKTASANQTESESGNFRVPSRRRCTASTKGMLGTWASSSVFRARSVPKSTVK